MSTSSTEDNKAAEHALAKTDFSSMVTVLVGLDEKPYYVHQDLVVAQSSFFRAALGPSWKEASEGRVTLPEATTESFDIFVRWLYFDHIPLAKFVAHCASKDSVDHPEVLIEAYLLGSKLEAANFRNAVVDAVVVWGDSHNELPNWTAVLQLYKNTLNGDHMRKLLVDLHVWLGEDSVLDEWPDDMPSEFFVEVSIALMRVRDGRHQRDVPPFTENICSYHEHPKGHPRCSKEAEEDESD